MTAIDDATEPVVLRPNRRVFLWRPVIRRAFFFVLLIFGAHFFLPIFITADPGLWVWLSLAGVALAWFALNRIVAYRRTFYEFYDDRLVVKTGTLTSRSTIDLPYRNVTQVVLRLPFIERRLFSTGHLTIHAAGSTSGVAYLQSIDDPRKHYDQIAEHLRDNGFSLARTKRLQREKPHVVGTLLDTSGMAIGGLIALVTIGLTVGGAIIDMLELANFYELFDVLLGTVDAGDSDEAALAMRGTLGLAILAIGAGTAGLAKLALHFVDLNRRTYTLWDDVVDYEDGFLTETYKFIPIENLADTATSEPFLKRLFGMANVHLSPHGAASGIAFPSMPRAARFRRHLDQLIETTQGPTAAAQASESGDPRSDEADADDGPPLSPTTGDRLVIDDGPPLRFGPSYRRRIMTGVINALKLPVLIAITTIIGYMAYVWTAFDIEHLDLPLDAISLDWIIYAGLGLTAFLLIYQSGTAIFFCWTTKYRVGRRKMTWERDFISRDEFEFTNDKITSVQVERDLVDRVMKSATITFRSIGNPTPLVFEDVPRAAPKIEEIRRRLGLLSPPEEAEATHRPRVSPLDFLWARIYSLIFYLSAAAIAAAASTYWPPSVYGAGFFAAVGVLTLVHDLIYYPRCRLRLFDDYLSLRQGVLFIDESYVPYDQIRSVVTTRYPGRKRGMLQLVSGSTRRISLPYLESIEALHEALDDRLYGRPMRPVHQEAELDRTAISTRRPQARNGMLVASVFTLFAALVLVVPLFLIYLRARRTSIVVQSGRVGIHKGIVYRSKQTVLNNRIDQLLIRQGPTHTLFKNGVVSVLTVGSSLPELVLGPVPNARSLYDELEQRLPGKDASK